jgi:hypothetical protein
MNRGSDIHSLPYTILDHYTTPLNLRSRSHKTREENIQTTRSKKEVKHENQTNYKTIFLSYNYSAQTLTAESKPGTDWCPEDKCCTPCVHTTQAQRYEVRRGTEEGKGSAEVCDTGYLSLLPIFSLSSYIVERKEHDIYHTSSGLTRRSRENRRLIDPPISSSLPFFLSSFVVCFSLFVTFLAIHHKVYKRNRHPTPGTTYSSAYAVKVELNIVVVYLYSFLFLPVL